MVRLLDFPNPNMTRIGTPQTRIPWIRVSRIGISKIRRVISVVLMSVATIVACLMCWFLRSEFTYAIADAEPAEVGDFASLDLSSTAARMVAAGWNRRLPYISPVLSK